MSSNVSKYEINDISVVGLIIEYMQMNNDPYEVETDGKTIAFSKKGCTVAIRMPHIILCGACNVGVRRIIDTHCTLVEPTVPVQFSDEELIVLGMMVESGRTLHVKYPLILSIESKVAQATIDIKDAVA